jgi:hypothetical protein
MHLGDDSVTLDPPASTDVFGVPLWIVLTSAVVVWYHLYGSKGARTAAKVVTRHKRYITGMKRSVKK